MTSLGEARLTGTEFRSCRIKAVGKNLDRLRVSCTCKSLHDLVLSMLVSVFQDSIKGGQEILTRSRRRRSRPISKSFSSAAIIALSLTV